jgi:hypothetical protein
MKQSKKEHTATNKTLTGGESAADRKPMSPKGKNCFTIVRFVCVSLLSIILFGASALAQYSSGVEGTVLDSSGAVIAGARIQLTNVDLGVSNVATSNDSGYFRIDSIPAGRYRLEVTAPSFKTYTETGVALDVGQVRSFSPKLESGATDTTVTVSAIQAAINLTSPRTDAVIARETVVQVPLVGQNVYGLAAIAPGVTGPGLSSGDNFNNQYGIEINAGGQRQESNSYVIDGVFVDSPSLGGIASISPNPEIVESVQVATNDFDAEKGRTAGAVTDVFTKSGTNKYHGTGDYFFLNNSLTSRTEFESVVPPYTRQEMGATIGGPILKNRLFGFGAIDVLRSSTINSYVTTVETQDFANYVASNFNTIDSQYFKFAPPQSYATTGVETIAQYEALYPGYFPPPANIPSTLPAIGTINYSQSAPRNGDQWSFRIDGYKGQHDRFYGNVVRTVVTSAPNGVRMNLASGVTQDSTLIIGDWTHTFSSHLLNEAEISLIRPTDFNAPSSSVQAMGFPDVSVSGVNIYGGFAGAWAKDTIAWRDTLSDTIKSHALRVGFYQENVREDDTIAARESYSFNNLLDFIQDKPATQQGVPINLTNNTAVTPLEQYRTLYTGVFVQDDWKARRNVTINAGLRYDSQGDIVEILNPPYAPFNFGSGATVQQQIANGMVTLPPKGDYRAINHNVWQLSPRLGFSWDIWGNGRTALRGGFGLFADVMPNRNITQSLIGNLPVTYTPSLSVYSGQTPVMNVCTAQGILVTCPLLIPPNLQFDSHGGIVGERASLGGFSPNTKMGQIDNFTLSVQQQLSNSITLELSYLGMASHHLPITTDINRFNGDLIANKGTLARLNPSFSSITYQTTNGNSQANYGSAMVTRQSSHGWSIRGIYTTGKVLDVYSTAGTLQGMGLGLTTNIIQAQDFAAQRGRADYMIKQQFTVDGVWTIPNFAASGWMRDALGGWRLGGLAVLETGLPFTVYTTAPFIPVYGANGSVVGNSGGDYNADGYDYDVPNAPTFGRHLSGQSRQKFLKGLFPASAFPSPALGQEGNLGRNTYDQPGYQGVDLNLEKLIYGPTFQGEKINIEFRVEMFNAFNHPNLINMDGNLLDASTTFGRATSQDPARTIQFHVRTQF